MASSNLIELIKKLRELTGAGMMDCKNALEANDLDLDKAGDYLREKGIAKAAKKAERIAAEGLSDVATCPKCGKYDNFQMDWFSQLFRDGTVYNQSDYASATWKYDGDDIVVTYFDSSGNVAHTQRFIVEEVRADIGVFVVRLNLNEEGTHYYRIPCQIDSEKYDDVDNPDWWWAEWE